MFFRKIKELQSLVNSSRKSLAEAEEKIVQRNRLIQIQREQLTENEKTIEKLEHKVEELRKQKRELIFTTANQKISSKK